MSTQNVFLIGFMGTGKSTIASYMNHNYDMDVVDMDQVIINRTGMEISDLFISYGEEYFRDLETELLKELKRKKNTVVSCGGGIVLREENVSLMKESGKIVLLTAEPQTILERLKNDTSRPLLNGRKNVDTINTLMKDRCDKYETAADIILSTDGRRVEEICETLLKELQRAKEREENV